MHILVLAFFLAGFNCQYNPDGYQYLELYDNIQQSWVYARLHYPSNATSGQQFPLIVFSPGWVQASTYYNYIWEQLVPMGYVIAMMATYDFDPNSDPWEKCYDQTFMLSYLQNASKKDRTSPIYGMLNSVSAAMGHSEGGWASLFSGDPSVTNYSYPGRFNASLTLSACWGDIDDAIRALQHQTTPIFLMTATSDCFCDDTVSLTLYNYSYSKCKYVADIVDGGHCDFGWDGFGNLACKLAGDAQGCVFDWIINPWTQQAIVKSYVTPWVNWILKQDKKSRTILDKTLASDHQNDVSFSYNQC